MDEGHGHVRFKEIEAKLIGCKEVTDEEAVFYQVHRETCAQCFPGCDQSVPRVLSRRRNPAHSVLLARLNDIAHQYGELIKEPVGKEVEIATTIMCMRLLVSVLWDMVIPKKEHELVVQAIEELIDIVNYVPAGTVDSAASRMLTDLVYALEDEEED